MNVIDPTPFRLLIRRLSLPPPTGCAQLTPTAKGRLLGPWCCLASQKILIKNWTSGAWRSRPPAGPVRLPPCLLGPCSTSGPRVGRRRAGGPASAPAGPPSNQRAEPPAGSGRVHATSSILALRCASEWPASGAGVGPAGSGAWLTAPFAALWVLPALTHRTPSPCKQPGERLNMTAVQAHPMQMISSVINCYSCDEHFS